MSPPPGDASDRPPQEAPWRLSCTSWSFPACTLREVAGIARALGVGAVDVGLFYASALDRDALLASPEAVAAEVRALRELGVTPSNYYHLFGATLADRNLADPAALEANVADFRRVARFCREAAIPTAMVLPGVVNPGQTRAGALAQSARALAELAPIAAEAGVVLTVEPHVHSYLESPALVAELLERVPGLALTLDYAHFVCLGYRQEEIDPLAPRAAHVHLRQARPGVLQAKLDQGTINFPALLGTLRDCGYAGYLALEVVHQDYMDTLHDDVLTETVRLRDLVRANGAPPTA
jgi:sugar phosphate isomerase/epimerase